MKTTNKEQIVLSIQYSDIAEKILPVLANRAYSVYSIQTSWQ